MSEVKFLLARGFRFEEIALACGLHVFVVYEAYLGKNVQAIKSVYRHYQRTGRLPTFCEG